MAQILNVTLAKEKRVVIGLTAIYGVGISCAKRVCKTAEIDENIYVKDLTLPMVAKLKESLKKYTLEGDLRRETAFNIKHLLEIGCYRGIRHRKHLPVRGQRTRCNARTRKGPRQTVANKKKASKN